MPPYTCLPVYPVGVPTLYMPGPCTSVVPTVGLDVPDVQVLHSDQRVPPWECHFERKSPERPELSEREKEL